ncbi:unnamed protein product [Lupinus luteus]|uniref:Reverse transcriptase domain-containing protein n=1 Tax=Lupinus luteus TaxID=3873 RepID=A0AAV1YF02_LUPLU
MRQAISLGFFKPYKVGMDNIEVSLLQFADDAILIGECSDQNIRVMKSILQLFELSSGLKINFFKSKLVGLNITKDQTNRLADYLQCKVSPSSFTYLGIPVGVNHKRKETWNPLIDRLKIKLSSWNMNHVSFGGRLILLNTVLYALLVYFLSIYKAPVTIINSIQKIQRDFLWGGTNSHKKINWVK